MEQVKFAHTGLVWSAICRVIVVLRLRFPMLYARYVGHVISGQSLAMLTMLTPGSRYKWTAPNNVDNVDTRDTRGGGGSLGRVTPR